MQKIILDTNFLIYTVKFKIPLEAELDRITITSYKIYVLDKTLEELNSLHANLALKLAERFTIIKTNSTKSVDDILVDIQDKDTIIATQDKKLKQRLSCQKLVIRQKKYLQII